ncbi:hypothetical protein, partial [Citrobacter freundii]|uniref:hypothetical protein n=1 Tax=Citrobacter freundii TaxID=546 RepID=UPI001C3E2D08
RRLACEPGGCSAPVAGYSACLTSFTSSIRFSLHAYLQSVIFKTLKTPSFCRPSLLSETSLFNTLPA